MEFHYFEIDEQNNRCLLFNKGMCDCGAAVLSPNSVWAHPDEGRTFHSLVEKLIVLGMALREVPDNEIEADEDGRYVCGHCNEEHYGSKFSEISIAEPDAEKDLIGCIHIYNYSVDIWFRGAWDNSDVSRESYPLRKEALRRAEKILTALESSV